MHFFPTRKTYGYDIQTPQNDPKPDSTKYKFDYTLQAPAEEKPVESKQNSYYTKVDRMTNEKSGKFFFYRNKSVLK